MGFIDSYKHLEKLCGEIFNDKRGISVYIDEMTSAYRGSYLVSGWDEDFKRLKNYRRIRNKIVHEPGYSEENMCKPEDAKWLEDFYLRIMNQTDPLTLYHKAIQPRKPQSKPRTISTAYTGNYDAKSGRNTAKILVIILAVIIIVVILLLFCGVI